MKDISDFAIVYCRHKTEQATAPGAARERPYESKRPHRRHIRKEALLETTLEGLLLGVPESGREPREIKVEVEEEELIPPVPVVGLVGPPVSIATGVGPARARSVLYSKTPSQKRKRGPVRRNLRATLVRDLRKRKKELTKELGQVKRDLKSLRAK